jgi:hypothetical protein
MPLNCRTNLPIQSLSAARSGNDLITGRHLISSQVIRKAYNVQGRGSGGDLLAFGFVHGLIEVVVLNRLAHGLEFGGLGQVGRRGAHIELASNNIGDQARVEFLE